MSVERSAVVRQAFSARIYFGLPTHCEHSFLGFVVSDNRIYAKTPILAFF